MKVRINTKLFTALVAIIGTLASLNIAAATQSITTASPSASTQSMGGMSMGGMGYNGDKPGSGAGSTDAYWREVRGADFTLTGKTRFYYIAAEEVEWDYCPNKTDLITGESFSGTAFNFVNNSATRIGCKYTKCLYFEYNDATFKRRKPRTADDEHLGFLGPTVRGEVGDIIKIVFLNKCSFPASVHPHAVFYNKDSEGAPYNDGTSGFNKSDDAVPTGGKHTYTWLVPERAGPGPMDGSSVMWMYHSHTDENKDFYAGLIGCMEITAKGMAKPDGSPKDVDREIFIMYSITNENVSPYLERNFRKYSNSNTSVPVPTDGAFTASNNKNGINGYIYGNGPLITVKKWDRVRWYVMSMGSFPDAHTPQWHGNTVLMGGLRMDVVSVLAAEMVTVDMCPDAVGIWMFHCHVGDHLNNGMETRYEVKDAYYKPW